MKLSRKSTVTSESTTHDPKRANPIRYPLNCGWFYGAVKSGNIYSSIVVLSNCKIRILVSTRVVNHDFEKDQGIFVI